MRSSCLSELNDNSVPIAIFLSNYNTSVRLRRTLDSLRDQTYPFFDIYLIDAGSSDDFLDVVDHYQDILYQVYQGPDNGLYDGLAKAFRRAQSGYHVYSYLNAGDLYCEYCLDVVAETFSDPTVHWITGLPTTRDSNYRLISVSKPFPYLPFLVSSLFYNGYTLPAIQQESTFWSSTLHYSIPLPLFSSFRLAGDAFLWSHFARSTKLFIVNCSIAAFTLHGDHLSSKGYHNEIRRITPSSPTRFILYPIALLYGLLQRIFRLPERVYSNLPCIINLPQTHAPLDD